MTDMRSWSPGDRRVGRGYRVAALTAGLLLALMGHAGLAAAFGHQAMSAGREFGAPVAQAKQGAGEFHWQAVRAPRHRCYGCAHRSGPAKRRFKRQHPCPSTGRSTGPCPGYVIDHIKPLKRGGADAPHNMQWQTRGAAKAKDRWE